MRTRDIHAGTHAAGRERPALAVAPRPGAIEEVEVAPPVTHEQIASRAYEIFCARGGKPGDELGDWLAAEHELRAMAMTVPILARRRPGAPPR